MVWGENRAFWVGPTEKMHTGVKPHGTEGTDSIWILGSLALRLGKRKSDNWPPGLTTRRSSFVSAKD